MLLATSDRDLSITDILEADYQSQFTSPSNIEPYTDADHDYWVKFDLSNELLIPKDLLLGP